MIKRSLESTSSNAVAGGAIGLLVGIAAGLSTAPVIAVIVGAISAGLLILLGLKKQNPATEETGNGEAGAREVVRITAFGIVCTLALILGVLVRAHDMLAPSAHKLEQNWKDAGFSEDQAREIVLYEKLGLTSAKGEGKGGGFVAHREGLAGAQSSGLFAAPSTSVCPYFDRHNYSSTDDMLNAMKLQGGALEKFAKSVEQLSAVQRDEVVDAVGGVLCVR